VSERGERLRRLIVEEIHARGPIPFERFMEHALYEPGLGYYACAGKEGGPGIDFRTSPQVGAIFARLVAAQVEECWRRLGEPNRFRVVEFGAGSLELARGIVQALEAAAAWPSGSLYLAVDPYARAAAAGGAGGAPASADAGVSSAGDPGSSSSPRQVAQPEALRALAGGEGVVLSNELIDALPVRRFVVRSGRALEVRVGLAGAAPPAAHPAASARGSGEGFVEFEAEVEDAEAREALGGVPPVADGFQFEINLRARAWMEEIGRALRRGYVLTLDYGYRRAERFRPERSAGTLLAYHRHRVERDLYTRVGEQDLTSHVDFDDLVDAGRRVGLDPVGLTDQMRFLTAHALHLGILEGEPASAAAWRERLAFKELIRPGGMGTTFRVLAQAKDAPRGTLTGFEDPFAS
jgi:SAM-dependent MidA family methyltransferase